MFKQILDNIKPLDYRELNGKELKMIYVEDSGYGLLSGQDKDGTVYILTEVKPNE